jgi:hypothetical protein
MRMAVQLDAAAVIKLLNLAQQRGLIFTRNLLLGFRIWDGAYKLFEIFAIPVTAKIFTR